MKTEKLVRLAAVTLMLCGAATGCKKTPQNTTTLYGTKPGGFTDHAAGPMNENTTGVNTGDLPASSVDFDKMIPNRDAFRDQTVYFDLDKANVRSSSTLR